MTNSIHFSIPIIFNAESFQQDLIHWYQKEKRDLPWRQNQDPYRIWVSEIMLQQTQVDTVIPYFEQFMERYPTVYDLAKADEQEVLKSWEGLGYYSRARNLHSAVREVVQEYGGEVPCEKSEIKKLKGVGPYTQGAILSIAYGQPEPAVDGNVMRVMSRILQIEEDIAQAKTKKIFEDVVKTVISKEDPSSFNQGLMELGALICRPTNPKCEICPVKEHCTAFEKDIQDQLPIKTKKKKQKREAFFTLILQDQQGRYLIQKRPEQGLLANMWEFPLVSKAEATEADVLNWLKADYGLEVEVDEKGEQVRHVFSHVIWELDVIKVKIIKGHAPEGLGKFVTVDELSHYPFPNVQQKVINHHLL
ncbi:A/G-specific adenine glycosylase [Alkalibacillus aidingensis]|uniref:A/G-specific adenine glycosylase n=1 Tax=Alkalibacillus aidingensis TaxID=2747607 RepID=UPI001CB7548B|nr:A/G-specific adenine glycosylase [Alkalibacillus aidingensis]